MSRGGRFPSVRGPMSCATAFLLIQLASGCAPDSPGTPAIAGPAAVPASAAAATGVGEAVVIRSLLAPEKCLTIQGGSTKQGTPTELRPCAGGSDQQFTFLATGEIRTQTDLCLDASSGRGNLGDAVIIWPCIGEPNQRWSLTSAGEIRGINDLCVDVWGAEPNDGQPIVVWRCHGGANQKWDVESLAATQPPADETLPPAQRTRVALAFDPGSSLAASSRVGPTPTAVGTPTYVAGPPARYGLDPKEAVDFGAGALDNVWTSPHGWTYIATVQTGARADAPHYILAKENSKTPQFAFFRNAAGGFELIVHAPAPSYENVQSVAVPDFATVVVAMRFDPQKPHGQRARLYINGAPAAEVSHTVSGTGGAIPASGARLRIGIVEWGGNRASPALGAAYAYSGVLTDAEIAKNSAWVQTNRLWQLPAPGSVASVEVVPGAAALEVGGARQFAATVRDAAGAVLS
ncbi:MAG: alpha-L-arabinofuranosidase, partial [Geminicoccaceae bacterium]|nr:alpha-L-arabinofuranosidase [Geminicoccaceae bacterium]